VASTRSRPHGREHARPSAGGVAAEHATKIYAVALAGIVIIVAFLALTSIGHVIDAATQHFMLFYAGVFALIGLCASVGLGLVATDRMFLHPGQRVFIQAAHRAASFGAVTFLIIHIVTEILAQRVHVIDAVVPFLSPFRTFYIGLGTIASDLIILLVITGIMRGRFNASGKAWRWRAIHYTSYAALVFGVWHGLLGGRPGKPYVDWSYGFVVAFVLLGLAVRILSNSLRPKENLSAPPVDQMASSASAPLRAAAMLAQYGATRGGRNAVLGATTGAQPMLSAPVTATVVTTALPAGGGSADQGQPYYEPGYEGPPRYLGAPRADETGPLPRTPTGPIPRTATGPIPRTATGPIPRATGPMPRPATGPLPRAATGSFPRTGPLPTGGPVPPSPVSGPIPRIPTGPMPAATGPQPRVTGSFPAASARPYTGPMPRAATGPIPQAGDGWGTGAHPAPPGPAPRGAARPRPRADTGPVSTASGPYPMATDPYRTASGSYPTASGSYPTASGSYPTGGGSYPTGSGSYPTASGSYPTGGGSYPTGSGSYPTASGSYPAANGPYRTASGPYERPPTGPRPQASGPMPPYDYPQDGAGRGEANPQQWLEASHDGDWYEQPPWEGEFSESAADFRYRDPGPGMPGYRGPREDRYGGDRY
jgi:DMSO/TMAO reductase YedYZ heme-binding membrane subunit